MRLLGEFFFFFQKRLRYFQSLYQLTGPASSLESRWCYPLMWTYWGPVNTSSCLVYLYISLNVLPTSSPSSFHCLHQKVPKAFNHFDQHTMVPNTYDILELFGKWEKKKAYSWFKKKKGELIALEKNPVMIWKSSLSSKIQSEMDIGWISWWRLPKKWTFLLHLVVLLRGQLMC